ncbi:MAG: YciI family protein [Demequinaceae bacterium]|nr:YciI family protein [Demequinaceae bacterium]
MPTYMIEYTYDDRTEERMSHRPDHLAYLNGLVDTGTMLAFGRFDDDGEPGALLIVETDDSETVEGIVSHDPYVVSGLVPSHRIRSWPVIWGTIVAKD